ncbi:hypothetical protein GS464_20165 [Rhodococcus hoagii]|nr:hypothetical protein [Prescottella equi]
MSFVVEGRNKCSECDTDKMFTLSVDGCLWEVQASIERHHLEVSNVGHEDHLDKLDNSAACFVMTWRFRSNGYQEASRPTGEEKIAELKVVAIAAAEVVYHYKIVANSIGIAKMDSRCGERTIRIFGQA